MIDCRKRRRRRPVPPTSARRIIDRARYAWVFSQMPTVTATNTITAKMIGEIFLLLPLRGESLAAWLNSVCISLLPKHRRDLVPQRGVLAVGIDLRFRRLCRADGIGRR